MLLLIPSGLGPVRNPPAQAPPGPARLCAVLVKGAETMPALVAVIVTYILEIGPGILNGNLK